MTEFWSVWIIVLTLGSLLICAGLIIWSGLHEEIPADNVFQTTHTTITPPPLSEEVRVANNPPPHGWILQFHLGLFFALIYFILYPALGRLPGTLHWTSANQYAREYNTHHAIYTEKLSPYLKKSVQDLAHDPEANQIGQSLYGHYCVNCHQVGGKGTLHYPNLTDQDWLWGGQPAQIEETIQGGRTGIMPAWGTPLGEQGVAEISSYVMTLSGHLPSDISKITAGKEKYDQYCIFCHAHDTPEDPRLGTHLTDNIWLHIYPGSVNVPMQLETGIQKVISEGVTNFMPARWETLDPIKIHLLTAYIYRLSHTE